MSRRGAALLIVTVAMSALLTLAVILARIVYNDLVSEGLAGQREKAFWLAEAGLEAGKAKLAQDPGWYTDLPSGPVFGEPWALPSGTFRLVRLKDRNVLCSTGRCGRARVVLQLTFQTAPLKGLVWSQI